jgi:hypothetical protein
MRRMPRETLIAILDRVAEVETPGVRYRSRDERALTLYVGTPGRAMAVDHVLSIELAATHAIVEIKERGTLHVLDTDIHAVLDGLPRARRGGGVGF